MGVCSWLGFVVVLLGILNASWGMSQLALEVRDGSPAPTGSLSYYRISLLGKGGAGRGCGIRAAGKNPLLPAFSFVKKAEVIKRMLLSRRRPCQRSLGVRGD